MFVFPQLILQQRLWILERRRNNYLWFCKIKVVKKLFLHSFCALACVVLLTLTCLRYCIGFFFFYKSISCVLWSFLFVSYTPVISSGKLLRFEKGNFCSLDVHFLSRNKLKAWAHIAPFVCFLPSPICFSVPASWVLPHFVLVIQC